MVRKLFVLAVAAVLPILLAGTASADIPIGQPMSGNATYYNDAGFGACGTQIDASTQMLVAAPVSYWTTPNPNNDPLCQGISIQVTYNGTAITVPVVDKCPTCDAGHIDLSRPAFAALANTDLGNIPVTWQFVRS